MRCWILDQLDYFLTMQVQMQILKIEKMIGDSASLKRSKALISYVYSCVKELQLYESAAHTYLLYSYAAIIPI